MKACSLPPPRRAKLTKDPDAQWTGGSKEKLKTGGKRRVSAAASAQSRGRGRAGTANDIFFATSLPASTTNSPTIKEPAKRKRLVSESIVSALSEWSQAAGLCDARPSIRPVPQATTPLPPLPPPQEEEEEQPPPVLLPPQQFSRQLFHVTPPLPSPLAINTPKESPPPRIADLPRVLPKQECTKLNLSPGKESFFDFAPVPPLACAPKEGTSGGMEEKTILFWDEGKPAKYQHNVG